MHQPEYHQTSDSYEAFVSSVDLTASPDQHLNWDPVQMLRWTEQSMHKEPRLPRFRTREGSRTPWRQFNWQNLSWNNENRIYTLLNFLHSMLKFTFRLQRAKKAEYSYLQHPLLVLTAESVHCMYKYARYYIWNPVSIWIITLYMTNKSNTSTRLHSCPCVLILSEIL